MPLVKHPELCQVYQGSRLPFISITTPLIFAEFSYDMPFDASARHGNSLTSSPITFFKNNIYYLRLGRHPIIGVIFTYYIIYARTMKVDYLRVQVWRATCEACSGNWEVSGTIPAFAYRQTQGNQKKNLCRDGRSQDLADTDFWPAFRHLDKSITISQKICSTLEFGCTYKCFLNEILLQFFYLSLVLLIEWISTVL